MVDSSGRQCGCGSGCCDGGRDEAASCSQRTPIRFRVLAFGPGSFTIDGETQHFDFRPEHAAQIVANAEAKGEGVPVDCEHTLLQRAKAAGCEESEVPPEQLAGERLACGFVTLQAEADGLWATVRYWTPRAAWLLSEGLYRHFSPVIRGLDAGNLRITSLALTNHPALDHQTPLPGGPCFAHPLSSVAVSASDVPPQAPSKSKGHTTMERLLRELAELLGLDTLALTAEGDAPPAVGDAVAGLRQELQTLRAQRQRVADCLGALREPLALGDAADLTLATGSVLALCERAAEQAEALDQSRSALGTLQRERDAANRRLLIDQGLASGQLTPFLVRQWADRQDVAALTAFLQTAPVLAPTRRLPVAELEPEGEAADQALARVAKACGVSLATAQRQRQSASALAEA